MAAYSLISDLSPSRKNPGYCYAYYDRPARDGGDCLLVVEERFNDGRIGKGFTFDDSLLEYDPDLRATVLRLGQRQLSARLRSPLPADPEAGWADEDYLLASEQEDQPRPTRLLKPVPFPPSRDIHRKANMAPELMGVATEVVSTFNFIYHQLGTVPDTRRPDVAQKLTAIALIPYFRDKGINSEPSQPEAS